MKSPTKLLPQQYTPPTIKIKISDPHPSKYFSKILFPQDGGGGFFVKHRRKFQKNVITLP